MKIGQAIGIFLSFRNPKLLVSSHLKLMGQESPRFLTFQAKSVHPRGKSHVQTSPTQGGAEMSMVPEQNHLAKHTGTSLSLIIGPRRLSSVVPSFLVPRQCRDSLFTFVHHLWLLPLCR